MSDQYPLYHENDVWEHVPNFVFAAKSVVLGTVNAARLLGMSHMTLLKYADDLGLSVIRRPGTGWRYFLVSELEELKDRMDSVSLDDLKKGSSFEITKIKKKTRSKAKRAKRA